MGARESLAEAEPAPSAPGFAVPRGASDCHMHVFGPAPRYPFAPKRNYTPPDALPGDAARMFARLGLERAVIVQPSVYGLDNRRLVSGLREIGVQARGVAAAAPETGDCELRALHAAGVRGLRLYAWTGGTERMLADMAALAPRIADLGWHLDLYVVDAALPPLAAAAPACPAPIVLDHMGGVRPDGPPRYLETLLRLLDSGRCWVKLSGPYRLVDDDASLEAASAVAEALIRANPERLVWGSDWPHTPPHAGAGEDASVARPFRALDTGRLLDLFGRWAPNDRLRKTILVDNPARLYGFDQAG